MARGPFSAGPDLGELKALLAELRKGGVIRASFHESGALNEVLLAPLSVAAGKEKAKPMTALESKRAHYAGMLNLDTVTDEMLEILP